ncbi:hypothetical protein FS763_17070 [Agrobacterium vitis]|uniref:hypothetical protein n=1 Tax=Allorhizobium ampelinum TaxID=3025782 RepID=UPI001F19F779|nr:hypothetical protein [Allorhizobium ampelinum]MCF1473637.1 hypothetical protein [Allorhizobium ampelinum]
MGDGRFDPTDWDSFTTRTTAGKTRDAVFSSRSLHDSLNPAKAKGLMRESRDGAVNPSSNPIIIGLDVTGSMGTIPDYMVRDGLPAFFTNIYERKPVSDPHVMFMGIGDVVCDRAPLQVSQFEADIRIAEQLKDLFLEGGGGGNSSESYTLPWYFAAMHTSTDAFEKRGKKGFLFTVGDEEVPPLLKVEEIERVMGVRPQMDYTAEQLLDLVSRRYHVFHVVVEQGSHFQSYPDRVRNSWQSVLGQHVLMLSDYTKLAEVVVSTIQIVEGEHAADVASSWSGDTALVVQKATKGLSPATKSGGLRWFGGKK